MRIFYIHQYFRTPDEGGAVRSYHLAKGLAEAGIQVEVISGKNIRHYDQQWIDGFKVHYLPVPYDQRFGFFRRVLAFLEFVRKSRRLLKKLGRADLLYVSSTPLTTGLIGLWAKKRLATPYIFEIRDIWPEAPIQVGAIRNPLLIRMLRKFEKKVYDQSLSLVALSPGIAKHVRQVSPQKKTSIIPNFSDLDRFFPQEKSKNLLQQWGLKDQLTIAYAGALGQVNGVEELLDLAELAKGKQKNWQFLIMGEGSHRELLIQNAEQRGLDQVRFFPFGSKENVNELLSLADFAWISFAHLPVLKTNSPNKFFDALAAGKAILVNHKGWVFQLVKQHQLGISCLPGKMDQCFQELEKLEDDRTAILQMQKNARKLAENYFRKELAVKRLLSVIQPEKHPPMQGDEVYILTA
ncbi:glycosyltransferase family 4 protein [Algoriphagus limi]|uniref:Glycosyltransferase family 4 protein n=1 Tax=Algoriphagus limi TaxID=2975273 RepID=A0ABT2G6W9_9BACT|nr:glycosyltransferase family 4 protein [Algoriphagus limi]MCS5490991.1 glycosyltransferase family 4 protein [Algoriphagus limi]